MRMPKRSPADRRRARRAGPSRSLQDLLYRLARWSIAHARGLHAALGLFLVVGLVVAALAAAAFALIAGGVVGGTTQALDDAAVRWVRARHAPWLDWLAIAGAVLGSGAAAWIALVGGTLVLGWLRRFYSVALLWIALVGGRFLGAELKAIFGRPRPRAIDWDLAVLGRAIEFPASPSFPSGHAVTSVVVFGTLALLIVRLEPTLRIRRITLAVSAGLILLIGLSRIYLGVHYPSDVVAGYLVGLVWVLFAAFALEVIRYAASRRPGIRRLEAAVDEGLDPVREAIRGEGRP